MDPNFCRFLTASKLTATAATAQGKKKSASIFPNKITRFHVVCLTGIRMPNVAKGAIDSKINIDVISVGSSSRTQCSIHT